MKIYTYIDLDNERHWFRTFRNALKFVETDLANKYDLKEDEYKVEFDYSSTSHQYQVCLDNKNPQLLSRYGYIEVKETED